MILRFLALLVGLPLAGALILGFLVAEPFRRRRA